MLNGRARLEAKLRLLAGNEPRTRRYRVLFLTASSAVMTERSVA